MCVVSFSEIACEILDPNFCPRAMSRALLLILGWSLLCLDKLLVSQLGVLEIRHRLIVDKALVQRQLRWSCLRVSLWSLILIGYCASAW